MSCCLRWELSSDKSSVEPFALFASASLRVRALKLIVAPVVAPRGTRFASAAAVDSWSDSSMSMYSSASCDVRVRFADGSNDPKMKLFEHRIG